MKLSLFTLIAFLQMATISNAKLQSGQSCDTRNACADHLYCDEGTDKCRSKTYANLGAACDKKKGVLCKNGNNCENKICVRKGCIKDGKIVTKSQKSDCCSPYVTELTVGEGKNKVTSFQCGL